jgi:PAS domain S-box-containing protein
MSLCVRLTPPDRLGSDRLEWKPVSKTRSKAPRDSSGFLELDRAQWEAVLDTARDAIVSIDAAGIVTLFNRTAEKMFGYDADEVLGRNVSMLMPSPYHEEHDQYLASYRVTGVPKAIGRIRHVGAVRRSGEVFPIELSVSEAHVADQAIYTAILRDVSERRLAEEALRRERDFAEHLIETAEAIVLVRDRDARIVLYNRYLERISGWPLAETKGRDWYSTFVPELERALLRTIFQQALSEGEARGYVNKLITRDGSVREIEWHTSVLRDADGAPSGVLSIGQDITERRRAEARVRELEKIALERERLADIGAITAKIAHDLGNPLSGVSLQAQVVLQRARRDPNRPLGSVTKPLEQLVSEVRRLEELIREFLSFAREQRLDLRAINLPAFLNGVVELWRQVASAHGVTLLLRGADTVSRLEADESKLRRVLDNLVKNAIEAMAESPGEVTVTVSAPCAEKVRISVEDSGPGIPPGLQVFRLFETTKENGSGLGLAVSKQIVLAHGGDLHFNARSPRGTAFHVELPIRRLTS